MRQVISSLQHPLVKYVVRLRKDKAFRKQEGLLLVVGKKMIQELLIDQYPIQKLFISEEIPFFDHANTCIVSPSILQKITGVPAPEPVAALVPIPPSTDLSAAKTLLILDGIQDPGNLGTLIRTALALGWEGVYITPNSCDPFNDKALRAAKGATFRIPIQEGSLFDLINKNPSLPLLVADLHGTPFYDVPLLEKRALLLSSESHGPKDLSPHHFIHQITIPMQGLMESLNVAMAGSILLHHFQPHTP